MVVLTIWSNQSIIEQNKIVVFGGPIYTLMSKMDFMHQKLNV
jgi:hypothetical protein